MRVRAALRGCQTRSASRASFGCSRHATRRPASCSRRGQGGRPLPSSRHDTCRRRALDGAGRPTALSAPEGGRLPPTVRAAPRADRARACAPEHGRTWDGGHCRGPARGDRPLLAASGGGARAHGRARGHSARAAQVATLGTRRRKHPRRPSPPAPRGAAGSRARLALRWRDRRSARPRGRRASFPISSPSLRPPKSSTTHVAFLATGQTYAGSCGSLTAAASAPVPPATQGRTTSASPVRGRTRRGCR